MIVTNFIPRCSSHLLASIHPFKESTMLRLIVLFSIARAAALAARRGDIDTARRLTAVA